MRYFPGFFLFIFTFIFLSFPGIAIPGADNNIENPTGVAPGNTASSEETPSLVNPSTGAVSEPDHSPRTPESKAGSEKEKKKDFKTILRETWELDLFKSGETHVHLNQIVIALLIFIFGIWISRLVTRLVGRKLSKITTLDENTAHIVQKLLFYLLFVIVTLIALPMAGIPITIFTVLAGGLAIGVGFGAQNLFNNLISGFIIMLERPIRVGDFVEVGQREGRIAAIGNRCVRVRRSDGVDVLVPNSQFLQQPVINWTLNDTDIRGDVVVGVAYGSPTQEVANLLFKAATEHEKVFKIPEPIVLFEEFGDNSLVFRLLFWCQVNRPMDLRKVQSSLRFIIDRSFREANITIAFPQRDVHLDSLSPIEVKMVE